jgi:TerB-C domain
MINNEWLLSIVAFIVGFTLTLLVTRNLNTALLAGLFAVPAAFAGLIAVNIQRRIAHKRVLTALQVEIRQMEKLKHLLQQDMWAIANQSDQIQEQINYRQSQFNWLQVQIGEKQKSKQDLALALIKLGEDQRQIEADIYHLNQQKEELDLSVRSLKSQHYKAETSKNELLADLQHLKEEIAFQKTEKQRLQETIDFLRSQFHEWQMEDIEVHDITPPVQDLTTSQPQKLLTGSDDQEDAGTRRKGDSESNLSQEGSSGRSDSESISGKEEISADFESTELIDGGSPRLPFSASPCLLQEQSDADLDAEWAEFVAQLTYPELEVLKAIVQQDNPNSTIKNIAESNITMPQLLIDGINERAIATVGDIIIEPGKDSPAIADPEYLETVKKLLEIKAVSK